jgi:hypothetical protein
MRLALAPKATGAEQAVVDVDEVVEAPREVEGEREVGAGTEGGVLGRRALDIKTRTLVFASGNL